MPQYNKNFLTEVIARLDYSPILSIAADEPVQLQERIRTEFPRMEAQHAFEVTQHGVGSKFVDRVWIFKSFDNEREFTLGTSSFALKFTKYTNFEDFKACFSNLMTVVSDIYRPGFVKRIGLRYVNIIDMKGNPYNWAGFLSKNLYAHALPFPDMKEHTARSMCTTVFKFEDYMANFNHGIYNKEFPRKITEKSYVLDYDCYTDVEREMGDVERIIPEFHAQIIRLFEASIGDKMRNAMMEQ